MLGGDDEKTNWNVTIIVAFFTFITSLASSYFLFSADVSKSKSNNIQSFINAQVEVNNKLNEEIRLLKVEINNVRLSEEKWRALYIKESLEKLEIQRLLNSSVEESQVVRQWIDDMPFSSWAKKRDKDGSLILIAVNQRFTSEYGLTANEAIGKTDFDLAPESLAQEYVDDDEEVIRTGTPKTKVVDYVKSDGTTIKMRHIKWRLNWTDGTYGVAGMVLDE